MSKKLVIVESPAKAKTIGKILGADYEVKASVGHVRDLPLRSLSVDIEHGFKPKYELMPGKEKVVDDLKKSAKKCDEVFLASDPDREGEAIAWHLREVLAPVAKGKQFHRVQYNEITPRAVHAAFERPGDIDMARVDAQQARRVLDRIVGYKVSPMLSRQISHGRERNLSAGRVQSVALRLVCERERQIQAFKPVEYWVLGAQVAKRVEPKSPFAVRLARIDGEKADVKSGDAAKAILDSLQGLGMEVADIRSREVTRRPLPPFTTSTLQQAASSVCGFAPGRTMSIAQKLYEGVDVGGGTVGLITYMRTDSVNISRDAQAAAREFIATSYGDEFAPDRPNFYKGRTGAQEAHEAIRPTDVTRTPESLAHALDPQSLKLYDLIWRRFVASQMSAARIEQRTVAAKPVGMVAPGAHDYEFTASASQVIFPGFLKVMALDIRRFKTNASGATEEAGENEADENIVDQLPPLAVGEALDVLKWDSERKETKPPARFSEAALVKELEANGIGRPSTYAAIIETLVKRTYVDREKRILVPTKLGMDSNDFLVAKLSALFDVGFTAEMESRLDRVEEGGIEWTAMLGDFYEQFQAWMEKTKSPAADPSKLNAVLALFDQIKEWAPGYTRGKKTRTDKEFVDSIREQLEKGEKPVNERQLGSLVTMVLRYRDQVPAAVETARALGFGDLADSDSTQPPTPSSLRKLELLEKAELDDRARTFVASLAEQARSGKRLSEKQIVYLNRIAVENRAKIPGFDSLAAELEIPSELVAAAENAAPDTESGPLLEVMAQIKKWNEPVKRGKRTFDDSEFFESVSSQFKAKGSLSDRQRAAMKRIILRYRGQIADFDAIAAKLDIKAAPRSARGSKDSAEEN